MSKENSKKIVVIGGLFDDCHRVGLDILERSLSEENYIVFNLGITVPLTTFFNCVEYADIVLVSSINGHAYEYLTQENVICLFERFRKKYPDFPILIGGNLHPYKDPEAMKIFLEQRVGFSAAVAKPVGPIEVAALVEKYLAKAKNNNLHVQKRLKQLQQIVDEEFFDPGYVELPGISNNCLKPGELSSISNEYRVLWKTSSEIPCLEDILNNQLRFPVPMASVLRKAQARNKTLIQPRCGVASPVEQLYIFRKLSQAGADVLSFQIDSNTRNGEFYENEKLLLDRALINGYPLINHGVKTTKNIVDSVKKKPIQVRHGSKPRISLLLAFQSLAAGVSGFEGGAGTYLFPYFKSIPLANSIYYWQYIDRLVGLLAEKGCIIDREFFGTLTATLIPPEIAVSVNIIETLLAARQGVRSISLGYAEQGNRNQDIAALMVLDSLTKKYLHDWGYRHVKLSTVLNSYMAGFPGDRSRAAEIIRESAVTARLGNATRLVIKTPVEALHIPTVYDNIEAIQLTRYGFSLADNFYKKDFDMRRVHAERKMIWETVCSIVDSVIESGNGDIAQGYVNAVKNQYLDVPFSPNFQVKGKMISIRDFNGAVRIYEPGNVQVPGKIQELHKALINERMQKEGIRKPSQLIFQDVTRIPTGDYQKWPLDGCDMVNFNRGGNRICMNII